VKNVSITYAIMCAVLCAACGTVDSQESAGGGDAAVDASQEICRWQYADCNGSPSDGCETRTSDDNGNCGACGNVCSGAHASMDCDFSICIVDQCEPGYEDCDRDPVNGCETLGTCD
jgi:hypothetical protein